MKPKLIILLVCIVFCISVRQSDASDVAGSQLTYQYLGGDTFHFTYVYYRDCFGTPAPSLVELKISSMSCGITEQSYNMFQGPHVEITNLCDSMITVCDNGTANGIQKFTYETDILISTPCSDWIFTAQLCCYSYHITTFSNVYGTYAEARMNNLNGDNSSPQFTNDPVISIYQNQDFHYNNGVVDPDGDSLAYMLIGVPHAPNMSVIYMPGYSASQPLSSIPPITFDDIRGDLFIHPVASEVGVIAYLVLEFRNGQLIGSVMRSAFIETAAGINNNPVLSGMNGTALTTLYVLPGTNICFDINSDDPDSGQVLSLNWNQGISAATFTVAGSPHPTGTFCWNTSVSDLRPQPYAFTATVADDNCPYLGVGVYSYLIYVTLDSTLVSTDADLDLQQNFEIYPNPSSGLFTLKTDEPISRIKIYNYTGGCIRENISDKMIDLRPEPRGIYFIEATTAEGKIIVRKIVKTD